LLHLVGATIAFGGLLACATSILLAHGETRLLRIGYFSLLLVSLPGWILMRLAGQWLFNLQHWSDLPSNLNDPAWLNIGFIVADWGGVLFLISLAVGAIGLRRLQTGNGSVALLRSTMVISIILAVAYAVAVWAMTGKPS
ncbi:MAG TPA: hypothetical protein VL264_10460, partial [Gaiella sp.]|nr:hypothetical protein [Gaiella sp.]